MYYLKIILLLPCFFSINSCEVTEEKKAKLLSDFINYYNFRPNTGHRASDGFLRSVTEIDPITYHIEVSFLAKSQKGDGSKMMKCAAAVQDLDDQGIAILNNVINCEDLHPPTEDPNHAFFTADVQTGRTPITLENEVQSDTSVTSGEQFIAIPRGQPSAPCIGCASVVNPQAQGVQDLASLGVRHLDIHEPNVKHSLDSVMEVERQVQVINGVRYILTLSILFDYCTELKTDSCMTTKTCKVSILVKPWKILPSGGKYRAILSNNCTEQWLFGDDGEVLPDPTASQDRNKKDEHTSGDDEIQVKRHEDVQSQPNAEKTLTPDEIKALEEQILPLDPVHDSSNHKADTPSSENIEAEKDHVIKVNTTQQYSENSLSPNESSKHEHGSSMLSEDKKKAIDEMLDFLKFSGYRPQNRPQPVDSMSRQKRSYDYDLQLLSLTEDYRDLKRSIENAKYIYEMAQATVDYLNEMDIEVKNRAVKNVIKAEEEEENEKHFVYLQVQVVIPCDTASCDRKQIQTKICNGVVDSTDKKSPQVLYTFCYADNKEVEILDKAKEIAFDDPVLLRLSKEVVKKMESDSTDTHAMKIQKIVSANTRVASGRLTKITMVVDYIDCSKSVPLILRKKCSALQHLGSRICEVLVHERQWLKEKKITYTCTERPIEMIITKNKQHKNITVDDPKIAEILQDALQYLETQSSKKNKQQIINVSKISTQVLAGFLIKIEFIVGYTNCSNNGSTLHSSKCLLLQNEHLRSCRAQVWDRSWIVDGRQMEVVCDEIDNHRSKRGIPGGVKEQNPDDPTYRQLAEESLQKYVSNSGDKRPHTLLRIEKVTTQVVAGSLTIIDFVAVPNDNPQGEGKKCQSRIWERPWLNEKEVNVTCDIDNHRSKRGIPGGVKEQNPDDPTYRQLAEESLQKYVSNSGDKKPHTLLRIEKVTTQVVAGSLTIIDFVAVPNDHPQGEGKKCQSRIWERPWLNEKEVNVTCDIDNHRSKRGIPGGVKEQNPDDPTYRQLAEESLQKYVSNSGDKKPHTLLRIEKVTTQVVAGSLTIIDFVAVPNDNPQGEGKKCQSRIWERPWLNEKEVNVTCDIDNHRSKRGIPGGVKEQNPDDPTYRQLAEESLQKYVSNSGDKKPHTLLRIEKVTTQVVAGSLTIIDFVAVSNDNPQGEGKKCQSRIWERPWLNEKEVNVTCDIDNHRSKRGIPGGVKEQNPDDPTYRQLAEESLQKYVSNSGDKKPHTLLRIEKVTTQVVAGSLTIIDFVAVPNDNPQGEGKKCQSRIWERPWLNEKEVNVTCDIDNHRLKRGIPGGVKEQNPDDPTYRQLAEESLQKYVSNSGDKKPHTLLRIEKVTTQVVAGSLTIIDFVAVPNDNPQGEGKKCQSRIWERPWLNEKEVTVTCDIDNHRSKRGIPGGVKEQNPDDPTYRQLAEESLQKYVSNSGDKKPHTVLRIEKVTTQVVAGSLTIIDFVAVPNDNPQGEGKKCQSRIWERPWLNEKEVTVTCDIDNHRSKRGIPGGVKEQNPDDPTYRQLAEESLQKYVSNSGDKKPHTLLRIEKVTTQVVAGSLTIIDFVAVPNDNPQGEGKKCQSRIWERPWLNEKEVTVTCDIDKHRSKRGIPGGVMEQNPDDPTYRQLAEESLQKYVFNSGDKKPHTLLRIEKVTTQVVAGSLTIIDFVAVPNDNSQGEGKKCQSRIWERRWLNEKEVNVTCDIDNHRSKRGIPGGVMEQNPDDPTYRQLAEESLQKYVSDRGDMKPHTLLRIETVTTQVVEGSLTVIDFVAVPMDNSQDVIKKCHSTIWERPWLKEKKITVMCEIDDHISKRELVGGGLELNDNHARKSISIANLIEQDPSEPQYLQLANESLQKFLVDSCNKEPHKVAKVVKVTTQIVSGKLTRLEFIVLPMNLSKSDIFSCYSEVWERPWTDAKDIKISCDQFMHIEMPKNTSYIQWANESLQKYLSDTRNHHSYKIAQIEQATLHNFFAKIIFVASSTEKLSDSLNCMSEIFNAPSLNNKEIHVICETDTSIDREKWDFINRINKNKHVYDTNNKIVEGDVKKPVYSFLALQSLRKFSKRIGTLHKLVAVSEVTKVSTSQDIVYQIKYSANPTECPFNVSNMRALTCQIISKTTLHCKAKIWEHSELPKRKMHVKCVMPEDLLDLLESEEEEKSPDTNNELSETEISQKVQESKANVLAKEALEQYLSIIHAKNVYRIIAIHSHYEYLADEIVEFAISPTKCLMNHFKDSRDNCSFVQPRVIYNCKAKFKGRALFRSDNDIKVTCRKLHMSKENTKHRLKRQIHNEHLDDAENEIDEDTMYYYAKSAVSQINTSPHNSNMFKLVTIHAVKSSIQMKAIVVKMYLEVAETYCLRYQTDVNLENCEEMEGLNHRLCLARIYPAPSDELVIRHVHVVCDDDEREFNALTGLHVFELLRLSIEELERKPETHFKLVHQGEPQLIPTLEAKNPLRLNFVIAFTNCSKTVDLDKNPYQCYLDSALPSKSCSSYIWLETATRTIKYINVDCNSETARQKRSSLNTVNATTDSTDIKDLVDAVLAKLEMSSLHRYKQRVLHINSYSSKITTGKVTTIDFDVAYTSCIKYEWVKNVTDCEIIDHLPRRHCVAQIWERLWIHNGQHINVTCEDDETPLEAHIEFESAEMASQLAQQALKHIEAKYPHPQKQKIVRIFSLEKQLIAGIHYKMKVEVGFTHCLALSVQNNCTLNNDENINRFCRVNVWLRPWTDHPPNFRVSCDFQESVTSDLYHSIQAEHLFYDFVTTYNPSYVNDHAEFARRFEIFKANIKKIHELNVHEKGTATYGVTRFADLTYKEFSSRYAGLNPKLRNNSQIPMKDADVPKINLPANFDWREFDAVTAVKDQGSCGSSWAFSVAGNIEGQWRMQSGELVSLSEQQLLDCDIVNKGCSGGLPENAYRTIEKQGGLETQLNYPYEGEVDKCLFNQTLAKAKISGSVNITSNETGMALWLVQNGPISIGINANAMQFYVNGISHPWDSYCDPGKLDHAALIVGYGVKEYHAFNKKITYWLVKNSWGTSWGEQGYYRVHRGTGTCGINRMATSAFIPSM